MIKRVPILGVLSSLAFGRTRSSKVLFGGSLLILSLAATGGYRLLSGQETIEAYSFEQGARIGRRVAPVTLNLKGKNPDVVYLGSYLVNGAGGCNQCHTCPSFRGIDPYKTVPPRTTNPVNTANYLAGGTPFENGAIVSPNLTPDSTGQPGGLSFNDFKSAMTDGTSPHKPGHILQVMPWPSYRTISNSDLHAIYLYLSSLPTASAGSCTGPGQAN